MESTFETNIKTNKRTGIIAFLVFWLVLVFVILSKRGITEPGDYLLIIVSLFIFLYLLWQFWGSDKVILTADKLTLEKRLLNIKWWQTSYDLSKVCDLQKRTNDQADTSSSYGKFDFGIFSYRPEFLRVYDKNPSVIYFSYDDSRQKIGEGLEEFNAELIIKEIKARQGK